MTGQAQDAAVTQEAGPAALRLRGDRPRVMRLSRKALGVMGVIASLGVGGALIYALQSRQSEQRPAALYSTENRPTADGLAALPRDYTGAPRLGPPLPGDLGRAIVAAQERGQPVVAPGAAPQADPAEQRRLAEIEAARTSRLFTDVRALDTLEGVLPAPGQAPAVAGAPPPTDADSAQNLQDRKLAFVNAPTDRRTVSPDRLADPPSPYVVQAGSVIAAALLTGVRSDLPGQVTAQITEHVYDSPTGRHLLIPQGSRLLGDYDSQVAFGQSRVLLVWTRLILPDGRSIVLERQPASDAQGHAGLEDGVDYHWGRLFLAAGLSTLLGVGAELGADEDDSDLVRAIRRGAQDSISQTGQQIVRRQLNVQPTLTIRPGFPVRVLVNRDLVLAPYSEGDAR